MELTNDQKKIVIAYVIHDPGKALLEDVPEILEGIPDEKIDELRYAVSNYVIELKEYCRFNVPNPEIEEWLRNTD